MTLNCNKFLVIMGGLPQSYRARRKMIKARSRRIRGRLLFLTSLWQAVDRRPKEKQTYQKKRLIKIAMATIDEEG